MKKLFKPSLYLFVILLFCILLYKNTLENIKYGIDLKGGFEILYKIEPLVKGNDIDKEDLDNTYKAIVNRIDTLGVSEPVISFEGDNLLRVQLPGISNEEEARERISTTAVLSFRDTNDKLLMTSEVLGRNGAKVSQNSKTLFYQVSLDVKDTAKFYDVTNDISNRGNDENKMIIWLDFEEGVDSYNNEKETCGMNGNMKCISHPYVNEAISSNVVIDGTFTKEQAQYLVDLINSGSLPTKLIEESTPKSVSASFGKDTIEKTGIAGIITLTIISIILIFKYRFSGLIGSITLIVYSLLVFIMFNAIDGVLTLTGIAALVLGVGMAVDSIIISIERVKDEVPNGKKLNTAFKDGNKSSLIAIADANITTLIAAIVLYIFGESSVRGYATMLIITIIATILTTVLLYRFLSSIFIKTEYFENKEKMFLGKLRKKSSYNFNRLGKCAIVMSLTVFIISFIFFMINGFDFGVDFTGGTSINLVSNEKIDFNKVKNVLKDYEIKDYNYYLGTKNEGNIKISDILNEKEELKIHSELSKMNIEVSLNEISTIVYKSLTKNAIKALIYSLVAIIIYIAIRFNFNFAVSSILMLVHDVLIILGIFAIFKIEVNFIIVAALLTIIGYSINDTIVVFDRIKNTRRVKYKNKKDLNEEELEDIINISSNETIVRNIWTSITTIISVITLIIVNLNSIFTFNIAIFIGIIAGSISSLLIGPKVWMMLEKRAINKKDDEEDDDIKELLIKGINS